MLIVQPALMLAFVVHIGSGALALGSGLIALFAAKGGSLHRMAGTVFFAAMLAMAAFAAVLAIAIPGQIVNLFISAFALYLVATGWLTIRRGEGAIGVAEKIAMVVALILCAPFAAVVFQMATGVPLFRTAFALEGSILVALYAFATIIAIAAIADVKVVLAGGISGAPRIARHLWRMCLGLTLAAGSASTNGFARLLPGPYHVPRIFFLPQLLLLGVLVFWVIRVRFTRWFSRRPAGAVAVPVAQEG
jgi:uncharacterized membrane protein